MLDRGRKDTASAKRLKALDQLAALAASSENKTQQRSSHRPMLRSSAVAPVTILTTPPQLGKLSDKAIMALSKDKFVGKTGAFLPLRPSDVGFTGQAKAKNLRIVSKILFSRIAGFCIVFQRKNRVQTTKRAERERLQLSTMKKQLTFGSYS